MDEVTISNPKDGYLREEAVCPEVHEDQLPDNDYDIEDSIRLKNSKKLSYTFGTSQPLETDLKQLLIQVTGKNDPGMITEVKLKVVSGQAGLHRLSDYTPNLRTLILDGSCIASFRDLGSSLKSLKTLSVARCNMKHLDGVWGFRNLEELNLRDNFVTDPSPCSGVKQLTKLDLRNNELIEVSYFAFLKSCCKLRELYLTDNNVSEYREEIKKFLPQLKILDGEKLEEDCSPLNTKSMQSIADSEEGFVSNDENSSSQSEGESTASLISDSRDNNDSEESKVKTESKLGEDHHQREEKVDDEKENENLSKSTTIVEPTEFLDSSKVPIDSSFINNCCSDSSNNGTDKSITHETATSPSSSSSSSSSISCKLSSGRLICGNLAVSLRARNPTKNPSSSSSSSSSLTSSTIPTQPINRNQSLQHE